MRSETPRVSSQLFKKWPLEKSENIMEFSAMMSVQSIAKTSENKCFR